MMLPTHQDNQPGVVISYTKFGVGELTIFKHQPKQPKKGKNPCFIVLDTNTTKGYSRATQLADCSPNLDLLSIENRPQAPG